MEHLDIQSLNIYLKEEKEESPQGCQKKSEREL